MNEAVTNHCVPLRRQRDLAPPTFPVFLLQLIVVFRQNHSIPMTAKTCPTTPDSPNTCRCFCNVGSCLYVGPFSLLSDPPSAVYHIFQVISHTFFVVWLVLRVVLRFNLFILKYIISHAPKCYFTLNDITKESLEPQESSLGL